MGKSTAAVYEPNHVFPVKDLENERIRLVLFIVCDLNLPQFMLGADAISLLYCSHFQPSLHSQQFFDGIKDYPEAWKYWMQGPFETVEDFNKSCVEKVFHRDPTKVLFAIIDKTGNAQILHKKLFALSLIQIFCPFKGETLRMAGCIALFSDEAYQSTEIGYVMILPLFQRMHVLTNAVGLLMHYCLELPSSALSLPSITPSQRAQRFGPGLGLRRVQWQARADNKASVRAAERMGFKTEGISRWSRILSPDKVGDRPSPERALANPGVGLHVVRLAMCWDDWELEGGREHVQAQMDRVY